MGICQCIENYDWFGSDLSVTNSINKTNSMKKSTNLNKSQQIDYPTNAKNASFINNTPCQPTNENQPLTSLYNKFKISNPLVYSKSNGNLWRNRQHLLESYHSQISNNWIESFSNLDNINDNNTSWQIDYYQLSRRIFDWLNHWRSNPRIVNTWTNESSTWFNEEMYPNKGDIIMWNEKVYLCCSSYWIEVEDKRTGNSSMTLKNSSQRVSERLKGNYNCWEFNVNGLHTPNVCLYNLWKENKNIMKEIISDAYSSGAVCCFPSVEFKMRTVVYLVKKIG